MGRASVGGLAALRSVTPFGGCPSGPSLSGGSSSHGGEKDSSAASPSRTGARGGLDHVGNHLPVRLHRQLEDGAFAADEEVRRKVELPALARQRTGKTASAAVTPS